MTLARHRKIRRNLWGGAVIDLANWITEEGDNWLTEEGSLWLLEEA